MNSIAKAGVKRFVLPLMFVAASQAYAQNGLEFPQQIRQRPIPTNAANQHGVAQAGYQAAYQSSLDKHQPIVQESGFPTLTPVNQSAPDKLKAKTGSFGPMVTTAFSLAVVLGLFAGLVWVSRRYGNGSMTQSRVPSDIMKSLGTTAIDARTQVTLLRCGNRIIVIAQTANGVHPLSEITDPVEVNRLTMACTGDTGPTFAETLQNEPRGKLFASA